MNTSLIKFIIINGLFLAAGYYIYNNAVPGEMSWKIAGGVLTTVWVLRLYFAVTGKLKTIKERTGGDISVKNIDAVGAAALPDWMVGYYDIEKKIYKYSWRVVTFAKVQAQPGFATHVPLANGIKALVYTAVICGLCAWGAVALMAWLGSGVTGILSAVGMGLLAIYLGAWILGDWRATKEHRHVIGDDALQLRMGVRSAASIPLDAIARCVVLTDPAALATGADAPLRISASSSANVLVELASKQPIAITRFGYPVPTSASQVALQLEHPHEFVVTLTQKLQARSAELAAAEPEPKSA